MQRSKNKLFGVKNLTRHCHPPFLVINCAATRRFLVNVVRLVINSVEEKASTYRDVSQVRSMMYAYRNVTSNQMSDVSCFYLHPRSSLTLLHLDKKLWTEEFAFHIFSMANVIRMCRGEKRLHATFQVASVESRKGSHPTWLSEAVVLPPSLPWWLQ